MFILAAHDPVDHVLPHRFFELLPFNFNFGLDKIPLLNIDFGGDSVYFSNHMLMTLVAAGLCLLIFPRLAKTYAAMGDQPKAPRGTANLFETILQFVRQDVAHPVLGHRTDAFMPFLWTLFFFILFCNLLGMVPLDSIVYLISGRTIQHVGGTATANLAVTGGLAICAFFAIHASGTRVTYKELTSGTYGHHGHEEEHEGDQEEHAVQEGRKEEHHEHAGRDHEGMSPGLAAVLALPLYLWNFAPHVFKPSPHMGVAARFLLNIADFVMWVVLLVLELIGAVIKPFALMIRLFANMVAGHIVLASLLMIIFAVGNYAVGVTTAVGCVALSCLELLVAFLQTYIFVFLTTLFIGMSVEPDH